LLWATRHEPHLDRCASAWLIKRFIDPDATFAFVGRDEAPPSGSIPFVLPGAEVNPVEGVSTSYDALVAKYRVRDPAALGIGEIVHDYEVHAMEVVATTRLRETAGVFKVVRGLARVSKSDQETVAGALVVFDSLHAQLTSEAAQRDASD
jgi:hypothetical protein